MSTILKIKNRGRPRKFDYLNGVISAQKLFKQNGFYCVSIDDICQTLGVPPTSIYAAYKNKLHLFKLSLELYISDFKHAIFSVILQSDNGESVFRELLEFTSNYYTDDINSPGCMLLGADNFGNNEEIKTLIKQQITIFEQELASKLAVKNVANPDDMAKVLLSLFTGLSGRAKNGATNDELLISIEFFCAALDC